MLRRVDFVKTDVSEELSASVIRVKRIRELGATLALTSNQRTLRRNTIISTKHFFAMSVGCKLGLTLFLVHRFCHPDDGGAKFLRNVGSHKSHTA
jgi:hypothetical protein